MAIPVGRFLVALGASPTDPLPPTFLWSPTWTALDLTYPNLVTSYAIDRGRQYELDRTDVGRATVSITDPDGILDPTNPDGPYYGKIEPLLQAMIRRRNPVDGNWYTLYRGFIEELDYDFDPSQKVNRLQISLVDIFETLQAIEMFDADFSDPDPDPGGPLGRPSTTAGQVWFEDKPMDDRIKDLLGRTGIPVDYYVVFSGNVRVWEAVYSPGESVMTAIQEAADAEFPGVSNVYCDRLGRLAIHGRLAKFEPATIHAGLDDPNDWLWTHWQAGDGAEVAAHPSVTAHIRAFAFNRGLAKVINYAFATPSRAGTGVSLTEAELAAQVVSDGTSIGLRGFRSWSASDLLTKEGLLDGSDDLTETKRFATYYVDNYAAPRNRITQITFRSMRPDETGAGANWALLSEIDVSDLIDVTVSSPGGGGFTDEAYFVEGIHEQVRPLNANYDDVTISLDLSPQAYFTSNPFPTS